MKKMEEGKNENVDINEVVRLIYGAKVTTG